MYTIGGKCTNVDPETVIGVVFLIDSDLSFENHIGEKVKKSYTIV